MLTKYHASLNVDQVKNYFDKDSLKTLVKYQQPLKCMVEKIPSSLGKAYIAYMYIDQYFKLILQKYHEAQLSQTNQQLWTFLYGQVINAIISVFESSVSLRLDQWRTFCKYSQQVSAAGKNSKGILSISLSDQLCSCPHG